MKLPSGSIPSTDPQFQGYVIEFRSQVEFLKDLAKMSWVDSPISEKNVQDEKMHNFSAVLDKVSEVAIDRLSYENFKTTNPSLTSSLVKMAIFLYLEDKIAEFYREAVSMNKDGLYALFDAVHNWTSNFLTSNYFDRPAQEIIRQYLMVESQFIALSEITGVEVLSIQDAASTYQRKVFEKLLAHLKKVKTEPPVSPSKNLTGTGQVPEQQAVSLKVAKREPEPKKSPTKKKESTKPNAGRKTKK